MSVNSLLNQTISLYSKSGKDKYGRESYGSSTDYPARVQVKTITRVLPNQETLTIEAIAYVKSNLSVEKGDKITYNSKDYRVYGIYEAVDGMGATNHKKLELEKWT